MKFLIKKYLYVTKLFLKFKTVVLNYPFLGYYTTEIFLFVDEWLTKPINWITPDLTRGWVIKGLLSASLSTLLIYIAITTGTGLVELLRTSTFNEIFEFLYLKNSKLLNIIRSPIENTQSFLNALMHRNSKNELNLALLKDVCPPNSQENPILNEDLPKRENNKNNLWKGFYILLAFIITTETFVEIINLLKE